MKGNKITKENIVLSSIFISMNIGLMWYYEFSYKILLFCIFTFLIPYIMGTFFQDKWNNAPFIIVIISVNIGTSVVLPYVFPALTAIILFFGFVRWFIKRKKDKGKIKEE